MSNHHSFVDDSNASHLVFFSAPHSGSAIKSLTYLHKNVYRARVVSGKFSNMLMFTNKISA